MTGRNAEWLACRAKRCRQNPKQAAKVCLAPLMLTNDSRTRVYNPHERLELKTRFVELYIIVLHFWGPESCPVGPQITKKPGY